MKKSAILAILVFDRIKEAHRTQNVLSRHSSVIKTRLGFHELSDAVCSRLATIILSVEGHATAIDALIGDLSAIGGIEVKKIEFDYLAQMQKL